MPLEILRKERGTRNIAMQSCELFFTTQQAYYEILQVIWLGFQQMHLNVRKPLNLYFPKLPSSVHFPMRQHILMEIITREMVQVLSCQLVSQSNWENGEFCGRVASKHRCHAWQRFWETLGQSTNAVLMFEFFGQSAGNWYVSIVLACNLQLARCDSILNVCTLLHEHNFNRLRWIV